MEYVALGINIFICVLLPFIILFFLIRRDSNKKRTLGFFIVGILTYLVMKWGLLENGMQLLCKNRSFSRFLANMMSKNYLSYSFFVALLGSFFVFLVSILIFCFLYKRNYSLKEISIFGLGFAMCEAVNLVGIRNIIILIEQIKGTDLDIYTGNIELYLSGYERLLLIFINIVLFVVLAYFVQKKKSILGFVVIMICGILKDFLPSFFMAFSTEAFFEIYSRNTALILLYIFLTAAAITGGVVIYSLRYSFVKERVVEREKRKHTEL